MLMVMGTHREAAAMTLLRTETGMNQRDLAKAMGVSQAAISQRETGRTGIDEEFGRRMLEVMGKSAADWARALATVKPIAEPRASAFIPLYTNVAAAGRYAFVPDCQDTTGAKMIDRGDSQHPCAFATVVHGDSMVPTLHDGDVIVCEPIIDEHDRDRLVDGRVVAVFAPDALGAVVGDIDNQTRQRKAQPMPVPQAGAVGRWRWLSSGEAKLEKDNPKAVPLHLPAEHVTTLRVAVVVELRRKKL